MERPIDACWYCGKNDGEMLLSWEFDTYLHEKCLYDAFSRSEKTDPEAWIFMHEFNFVSPEEWEEYLQKEKEASDPDNYGTIFMEGLC